MVSAESTIKTEEFTYGDGALKGYIAYDSTKTGKLPAIFIVHEAPGFGEYTQGRARQIAELGYLGFAVDMVGGGKGFCGIAEADASLKKFEGVKDKYDKALEYVVNHEKCDPKKVAGIGYCYGGIVLLNMARLGADLKGVAVFHGGLKAYVPLMEKGKFKGKVLICNGEADPLISKEEIDAFKKEFDEAGVPYKFINYPDAKHAFTNPKSTFIAQRTGLPFGYNEKADKESWAELVEFLKDIFSD